MDSRHPVRRSQGQMDPQRRGLSQGEVSSAQSPHPSMENPFPHQVQPLKPQREGSRPFNSTSQLHSSRVAHNTPSPYQRSSYRRPEGRTENYPGSGSYVQGYSAHTNPQASYGYPSQGDSAPAGSLAKESIRPKNKSEWFLIALVSVLAVSTVAYVVTRLTGSNSNQQVQLQAIQTTANSAEITNNSNQAAATTAQSEPASTTTDTTTTAPTTTPTVDPDSQWLVRLQSLSSEVMAEVNTQVQTHLRDLKKYGEKSIFAQEETEPSQAEINANATEPAVPEEPVQPSGAEQAQEPSIPAEADPTAPTAPAAQPTLPASAPTNPPVVMGLSVPSPFDANNRTSSGNLQSGIPSFNQTPMIGQSQGNQTQPQKAPPGTPAKAPAPETVVAVQMGILDLINQARAAAGLRTLQWDATLQGIANIRATELYTLYSSAHTRPNGQYSISSIAAQYGSNNAQGENIGYFDDLNSLSATMIFNMFYNSGKGHKEIMMTPGNTRGAIGIYCVEGAVPENGTGVPGQAALGRFYVSMNFGN